MRGREGWPSPSAMQSEVHDEVVPRPAFTGIYGIVDLALTPEPVRILAALLRAGIRIVQYRAKAGVDTGMVVALRSLTQRAGAVLIVNDDIEAALAADGWHGGQEDLAAHDASTLRARLGSRLLGISCATPEEALHAERLGADYIGVGPFAATATKFDAGEAIGATGVARVVAATRLPVIAIGGIDGTNVAAVRASGAAMAAVISAVARAPDPEFAARALVERWAAGAST